MPEEAPVTITTLSLTTRLAFHGLLRIRLYRNDTTTARGRKAMKTINVAQPTIFTSHVRGDNQYDMATQLNHSTRMILILSKSERLLKNAVWIRRIGARQLQNGAFRCSNNQEANTMLAMQYRILQKLPDLYPRPPI